MGMMRELVARLCRDEGGATAIEYALIAMLVAVAIIASVGAVGSTLRGVFGNPELVEALGE